MNIERDMASDSQLDCDEWERSSDMTHATEDKMIAIPCAQTALAERLVEMLMRGKHRLALGVPQSSFQQLEARLDGRERVYGQPLDLDSPASANTFFQIAFAQLGQPDIVVLETLPRRGRGETPEDAIEIGTRRLLHCLDAALSYVGRDLHLVCITPAYGLAAIPIATAFLAARSASDPTSPLPRVRMSVVSPPVGRAANHAALARTILQILRESRSPDVTEAILNPTRARRHRRRIGPRSTIEAKSEAVPDAVPYSRPGA